MDLFSENWYSGRFEAFSEDRDTNPKSERLLEDLVGMACITKVIPILWESRKWTLWFHFQVKEHTATSNSTMYRKQTFNVDRAPSNAKPGWKKLFSKDNTTCARYKSVKSSRSCRFEWVVKGECDKLKLSFSVLYFKQEPSD